MSRADRDAAEPDVTPETEAIREDIEQTRAGMGGTIDAIQEKLDPEGLQEQAKDTIHEAKQAALEVIDHAIDQTKQAVRGATIGKVEDMARYAGETAGGWRQTLTETVKAHPVPAAIAGLALGYLFLNRESGPARPRPYGGATDYRGSGYRDGGYRAQGYGAYGGYRSGEYDAGRYEPSASERAGAMASQAKETAGSVADQAQERVGQAAEQVQETAGQVTEQVQETAGQVVDQVQEQAQRARSFLERQLDENPLAVGAVAVLLGGALASVVGTTPREDRMFGAARDRLMGRAGEVTQETLEKVERVADEVTGTVARAAEEVTSTAQSEARAQDLLPEDAGSAGSAGSGATGATGAGAPGATGSRPSGSRPS